MLATHGRLSQDFFWQAPFYPLYLGGIHRLTGASILAARLVQAVLGAATCVLTYWLGRRVLGRAAGVIAAGFTAFYGPLIYFELDLIAAGWAALVSVILLLLFLQVGDRRSPGACFALGLCGILSILVRPVFLPAFLVGIAWLGVVHFRSGPGWRSTLWSAALASLGFALVAVPTATVMHRQVGIAAITPYSGGLNFYIGNNPEICETLNARPGWRWERIVGMPDRQGIHDPARRQRFFYDKVRAYAASQPLSFATGMLTKAARLISSREIPRNEDVYLFGKWSHLLDALTWKLGGFGFPFGVLLPLAAVGLLLRHRRMPLLVPLFIASYGASLVAVFPSARYRVPVVPALTVLVAAGCLGILDEARRKRWGRLGIAGICAGGVVLLATLPGPFCEEAVDYEAELYSDLGTSSRDRGELEQSFEYFSRARALNPDLSDVLNELARYWFIQAERQRKGPDADAAGDAWDKGISELLTAKQVHPENPKTYSNLGWAAHMRERLEEALGYYAEALRLDSANSQARYLMGVALVERAAEAVRDDAQQKRDLADAVEHLSLAVSLNPRAGKWHGQLAAALLRVGRVDEAAVHFRTAARLGFRSPSMLREAAWIMATDGNVENRNGAAAVEFARAACDSFADPGAIYLDTLAAAYAEAGEFALAAETVLQAIIAAERSGQRELAGEIRVREQLYLEASPFHQPREPIR
jgi:tetratricopeptide (TPR) repeat protein